jgi:hypothetical protein
MPFGKHTPYTILILAMLGWILTACAQETAKAGPEDQTVPVVATLVANATAEAAKTNNNPDVVTTSVAQTAEETTEVVTTIDDTQKTAVMATLVAGETQGTTPVPTEAATPWQELPVVPTLSARARQIYEAGLAKGNNPQAFSKVGDCESRTTWFLWDFDQKSPDYYTLGEYTDLQTVIDYFAGSHQRLSQAAKQGFTAASVMSTMWSDVEVCERNETPLACEYRQHRPAFVFITLGTNDGVRPETFEKNIRRVIDYSIEQGVVPILATKADNMEGDHSINATIASLAQEYDIPLWNFWRAVQDLPDQGLQEDGSHLTWAPNQFDDPSVMKKAWPLRNLTALQVLDALLKDTQKP